MSGTLHDLLGAFAAYGDSGDGGVRRLTGTAEDKAARDRLAREFTDRRLVPTVDRIGNQFGIAHLVSGTDDAVIVGSHLDSQPTGGRFDGVYGVLAGLLATEAVMARAAAAPGRARRNLVVANWTNEEGARFQPSLTGSSVFTGALALEQALSLTDGDGHTLGTALSAIGYAGSDDPAFSASRYVEIHVEQGDRLEAAGVAIGVVEGAFAARKLSIVFVGAPSHTGPTAMSRRRDALRAAARAIDVLHDLLERDAPDALGSAARITVFPNSPNVVPCRVQVWFEIRHAEQSRVLALGDLLLRRVGDAAEALGVAVDVAVDERRAPIRLDAAGAALATAVARDLGHSVMTVLTVAGHDAVALARRMPSTLVFVPSVGGLSHSPLEFTEPAALDAGLAVLTEILWRMVTDPA